MEVELFVHGVPNGQAIWGKEEDRNYFGGFYDNSSDEVKFLVQARAPRGKPYCYYNYLVYRSADSPSPNVIAYDGRSGSYFGITLRLDAYCKDVMGMYRILDTIYNVYVLGHILINEKSKLKYTTPDFQSVSNALQTIEKEIIQLIQIGFSSENFISLDGFATLGDNCPRVNIYDCSPDNVFSMIKQYSCIAVSPYYSNSRETQIQQQCKAQIETFQQQCKAQIEAAKRQYETYMKADSDDKAKINNSLTAAKKKVTQLQNELNQKDDTIIQLKAEKSQLQSEIKNIDQGKKIDQIIAPIREPISQLSAAINRISPAPIDSAEYEHKKTPSRSKKIRAILPLVNFCLLLAIAGAMFNPFRGKTIDSNGGASMERVESLEKKNKELQEQLEIYRTSGNGITDDVIDPMTDFNMDNVKIDIRGYNGGDLKMNQSYTVRAINGSDTGNWAIEGGIIEKTDDPKNVTITPTSDVITITYSVGGQKKERELKASK